MRYLSLLPVLLFASAACGGSVSLPSSSTTASAGGGTTTASTTASTTGTGGGSTSTMTGAGGGSTSTTTGTGGGCLRCAQALPTAQGNNVCPGVSTMLFDTAKNCICNGPCKAACDGKSQLCGGPESPAGCIMCENDPQNGCGTEWQACINDHS